MARFFYEHSLGCSDFSKSFMLSKCFQMMSWSSIAFDVTLNFLRGVYCSNGDAPEGDVLEEKFLEDRRPKLSFWPRECIDIKDDLVQFWCGNMVKLSALIQCIGYLAHGMDVELFVVILLLFAFRIKYY